MFQCNKPLPIMKTNLFFTNEYESIIQYSIMKYSNEINEIKPFWSFISFKSFWLCSLASKVYEILCIICNVNELWDG